MKHKFFNFLSMAFVCVVAMTFISCGDDDDDVPSPSNPMAKVLSEVYNEQKFDVSVKCDLKGRITECRQDYYDRNGQLELVSVLNFVYNQNVIVESVTNSSFKNGKETYSYTENISYKLNSKGLIESATEDGEIQFTCTYDANDQLIKWVRGFDNNEYVITWKDGNPVKFNDSNVTYTSYEANTVGLKYMMTDNLYLVYPTVPKHCSLIISGGFGKTPKNMISTRGDETFKYTVVGGKIKSATISANDTYTFFD